jgi:hypothetical protein
MLRQVFQANAAKLPQYVGAETAQNGYVIARVDTVKEGDAVNDANRKNYAQQLRKLAGEEMFHAYLEGAKQQVEIKVNLPAVVTP